MALSNVSRPVKLKIRTNLRSMMILSGMNLIANDHTRARGIFFRLKHIKYARSIMKLHYSGKVERVNGLKACNARAARGAV